MKKTKSSAGRNGKAGTGHRTPSAARHECFAREYALDFNGTRAYKAAYPNCKSESAAAGASNLLRKPKVLAFIAALGKRTVDKLELTRERSVLEAARLAYSDVRKLSIHDETPLIGAAREAVVVINVERLKVGAEPLPLIVGWRTRGLHEIDDDTAAAMASFELDEHGRIVKFKYVDKNPALERVFKHQGLFDLDNSQRQDGLRELLDYISGMKGSRCIDLIKPQRPRPLAGHSEPAEGKA